MIISVGAGKTFDKIQHPFLIKKKKNPPTNVGIENTFQHSKNHLWQTHSQPNTQQWKVESILN